MQYTYSVSRQYIGPLILEESQIQILTRVNLLYPLCYEIPCSSLCYIKCFSFLFPNRIQFPTKFNFQEKVWWPWIFICALHFHENVDVGLIPGFPRRNSPCVHDDLENLKHCIWGIASTTTDKTDQIKKMVANMILIFQLDNYLSINKKLKFPFAIISWIYLTLPQ